MAEKCSDECRNREKNLADCPCTYDTCKRRGICCECIANRRANDSRPARMQVAVHRTA
jgi:hypothetical protein